MCGPTSLLVSSREFHVPALIAHHRLTSLFSMIGSQLIGYGLAGIMRVFLVYPTFAVYPQLVPTVQLFDTLHRGKSAMLQKKRMRFFWAMYVFQPLGDSTVY